MSAPVEQPEISQEAARAMLAALRQVAYATGNPVMGVFYELPRARSAVLAAIALAEGRAP